jgi:hypothetical protein
MKHRSAAGLAGLVLALLLAAPTVASAGPTVTVRVEGTSSTPLERTRVTLPDSPPPVASCPAHTAAAAIEVATAGNWDRQAFTQTILGELHDFSSNDYWAEWVNRGAGYKVGNGVCNDILNTGDEVLMVADVSGPPPDFLSTRVPLELQGVPAQAVQGSAITLSVVEARLSNKGAVGDGVRTPVAGATVRAGSASATTGSDGRATLTLSERGTVGVRATRPGNAQTALEVIEVGDVASASSPPDRTAPTASIDGIRDGRRFTRRRAPRELSGTVTEDPSGLWAVKIRLTRRLNGKCWYFSGSREQFVKRTCGKQYAFKVGDRAQWSYLLPARLPRGRYVLSTYAIDNAFNRGEEQRVVFRVR